jgi:hypothetical protein
MDYDKVYGSIQKLRNKGKHLVVFQEIRTGRVLVNEQILSDLAALSAVQKSDQVLSDITYYADEFGIAKNPESFAEFANSMYFTDAYRGAVLRLSLDGINKISNYGLHTFFNNRLPKYINSRLWGVYNERFDSYVLSFDILGVVNDFSIYFHEPSNRWTSLFNFGSQCSVTHGVDIVTFKGGRGWLHNSQNVPYCNFYGEQFNSSVEIAFNQNPSNNKFYKTIELESNDVWEAEITNQYNQKTSLIKEDYDKIENVYWASFWKDENSTGGLIEGDDMRSPELIIKLSNDNTTFVKLFSVGVKYEHSELTNR